MKRPWIVGSHAVQSSRDYATLEFALGFCYLANTLILWLAMKALAVVSDSQALSSIAIPASLAVALIAIAVASLGWKIHPKVFDKGMRLGYPIFLYDVVLLVLFLGSCIVTLAALLNEDNLSLSACIAAINLFFLTGLLFRNALRAQRAQQ